MHSEAAWSVIDPKPLTMYLPRLDAHIVFWNGVATTRSHALMVAGTVFNNIWSTPTMKESAWKEFNRIYRAGGFGTRAWDTLVNQINAEGYYHLIQQYISKRDQLFFTNLKKQYSPKVILEWFHPSREIVKHDF